MKIVFAVLFVASASLMLVGGLLVLNFVAALDNNGANAVPVRTSEGALLVVMTYATICLVLVQIGLAWWQLHVSRSIPAARPTSDCAKSTVARNVAMIMSSQEGILSTLLEQGARQARLLLEIQEESTAFEMHKRTYSMIVTNKGRREANRFLVRLYLPSSIRPAGSLLGIPWTCVDTGTRVIWQREFATPVYPHTEVRLALTLLPRRNVKVDMKEAGWSIHYGDGAYPENGESYVPLAAARNAAG